MRAHSRADREEVCKPLLAQSLNLVCHVGKSVPKVAVEASEPGVVVVQLSLVFREHRCQVVVECNQDGAMRSWSAHHRLQPSLASGGLSILVVEQRHIGKQYHRRVSGLILFVCANLVV